jgi:hypothetical protein
MIDIDTLYILIPIVQAAQSFSTGAISTLVVWCASLLSAVNPN